MDRRARPAHGIVVYPSANSLTAFYTTMPIRLSASDGAAPFFAFGRLRTVPLSTTGPLVAHRQLVAFLAQEDYPRIWFIATRVTEAYPLEPLIEVIRARGYRVRKQWNSRIKTQLILFEREN